MSGSIAMQSEAYLQIMKQLIRNPCKLSEERAWNMFAILLSSFPPPPAIENFVVTFLKKNVIIYICYKYLQKLNINLN